MIGLINRIKLIVRRMPFVDYIYELVLSLQTHQETGGEITTDGNLQTVYTEASPLGVFKPRFFVINLDDMQGGDTIELTFLYRIDPAGNLEQEQYDAPTGADGGLANGNVLKRYELMDNRYGILIQIQRTAGVDRDYPWEFFEEA